MLLNFRAHTLFAAVLIGSLALGAPARAELPADNDSFTFVTDEDTGALYECSASGCRLVASPLQAEATDGCEPCSKHEIMAGRCAVQDAGEHHCKAPQETTSL